MLSLYKRRSNSRRPLRRRNVRSFAMARPWATYNPRRALFNPRDPFSDSFVHKFRRLGLMGRLYAGGGNLPSFTEDAGPGVPAFNLGPATTDSVAGANLAQFGLVYTVHLDSVLNFTDLTDLFNEYRIDKVDLRIDLINGPSGQPNVSSIQSEMFVRYDPNDATMPISFGDVCQSANTTQFSFSQKTSHHFSFLPKAAMQVYGSTGVGYAQPQAGSMWFDTSGVSRALEMFGLKMWLRNFESTLGSSQILQFQPTFFISCRRPR